MTSSEYPTASSIVEFSRNFSDIFAAATEGDKGRMTRSMELGYGYLGSDFDSVAAGHASAALCHFFHAQEEGKTEEQIAYHLRLASGYADMALGKR
ncbi:hypothetical protein SEA_MABODAMACA_24 [Microbacterium phage Mabodamaca]|uniref:Uncharacterized protein n=1 Tax=Microbacterium phage Mabodamaca TaxID=3078574 RepID=A0AA96SFV7_9CAUD|nr:hypothetical protein SEA_MABODAMACA_24 [Microbacterium phage Mabodamaca]